MNLVFLDTETTGFGQCRLIELAWALDGSAIINAIMVKPPVPIEAGAMEVHGITEEMVKDLMAFQDTPTHQKVKELFENSTIVAHNASFDIAVLKREGINVNSYIDTKKLAMKLYKKAPNHKLQTLRSFLGLSASGDAHSASGDVAVLVELFERMRSDMRALNIHDQEQEKLMVMTM